nr:MAG TPA: hypothetical protein [Caudoviricetes sp.]
MNSQLPNTCDPSTNDFSIHVLKLLNNHGLFGRGVDELLPATQDSLC